MRRGFPSEGNLVLLGELRKCVKLYPLYSVGVIVHFERVQKIMMGGCCRSF